MLNFLKKYLLRFESYLLVIILTSSVSCTDDNSISSTTVPTKVMAPTLISTTTPMPLVTPTITRSLLVTPGTTSKSLVTLQWPLDSILQGQYTFYWQSNLELDTNQYYELIFWSAGSDPLSTGFGPVGARKELAVDVDLDRTADTLPHLFQSGGDYQWGVLLVELNPYRRLSYLGGGQKFRFQRSQGSGSRSDAGQTPTPRGD